MMFATSIITLSHVQSNSVCLSRAFVFQFFAQIFPGVVICIHSNIPSRPNPPIYSQVPPNSAAGPEDPAAPHIRDLQLALDSYLRKCADTYNLERNCEVRGVESKLLHMITQFFLVYRRCSIRSAQRCSTIRWSGIAVSLWNTSTTVLAPHGACLLRYNWKAMYGMHGVRHG